MELWTSVSSLLLLQIVVAQQDYYKEEYLPESYDDSLAQASYFPPPPSLPFTYPQTEYLTSECLAPEIPAYVPPSYLSPPPLPIQPSSDEECEPPSPPEIDEVVSLPSLPNINLRLDLPLPTPPLIENSVRSYQQPACNPVTSYSPPCSSPSYSYSPSSNCGNSPAWNKKAKFSFGLTLGKCGSLFKKKRILCALKEKCLAKKIKLLNKKMNKLLYKFSLFGKKCGSCQQNECEYT